MPRIRSSNPEAHGQRAGHRAARTVARGPVCCWLRGWASARRYFRGHAVGFLGDCRSFVASPLASWTEPFGLGPPGEARLSQV